MQSLTDTATSIAEKLLSVNAIKLQPEQPFTWTSGWISPIYNDNRLILSHPEIRKFVKESLASLIKIKFPQVGALAGVATAGIAPGALAADALNLPFGYVRSEAKKHGMGKQVEGDLNTQLPIVVVEDLVSTGKSSLHAVEVLRAAGYNVVGLVSIFTYGFDVANLAFAQADCPFYALCTFETLVRTAQQKSFIKAEHEPVLERWRQDPANWKPN